MSTERPAGGALRVAIVAANAFEFDTRSLYMAQSLAADGHHVTVVAFAAPGLQEEERLGERIVLRRVALDRRIASAFRPLPRPLRHALARLLGLDPSATTLPPADPRGPDRLRAPLRRAVEILAHARRVGPWSEAVLRAAPDADVFEAQSLIALPVVRRSAARRGGRYVYDVADFHSEAERLARMPRVVRTLIRSREARWAREAAGMTAVTDAVAAEVERRFQTRRPVTLLNCAPAWRPESPEPPASTLLRDATGVAAVRPIVLYQGGFSVERGLEELVAAADEPALAELDAAIVLLGYGRLESYLRHESARRPGRLFVLDAVPPDELLEWTASADLSYIGQPPRTLNFRLNLPNKLFQSLMAGVPLLGIEGTEHCRIIRRERVGACSAGESPAAIATAAAELLSRPEADRAELRAHCRRVALERYTWERNDDGLVALYRELAAAA